MNQPLLPTFGGGDWDDVEAIQLGDFEPRPPGQYLARVKGLEDATRDGRAAVRVTFELIRAVQLAEHAQAPESLGTIRKLFFPGAAPLGASADTRKKYQGARGIFKGFYQAVTGITLSGPAIDWGSLVSASPFVLTIGWQKQKDGKATRDAYTYSEWLATGKPSPRGTFFQDVAGFRPAKPEETTGSPTAA